jgi:hypothetical protein
MGDDQFAIADAIVSPLKPQSPRERIFRKMLFCKILLLAARNIPQIAPISRTAPGDTPGATPRAQCAPVTETPHLKRRTIVQVLISRSDLIRYLKRFIFR